MRPIKVLLGIVGLVAVVALATTAFAAKRHLVGTVKSGDVDSGTVSLATTFKHHETKSIRWINFHQVPMSCNGTTFLTDPSFGSLKVHHRRASLTVTYSHDPLKDKVTVLFRNKGRKASGTVRESSGSQCDTGTLHWT